MKKVIQIIHGLSMGGAEKLVYEYCLKLDKTEFEVVLLCFEHCNLERENALRKNGVRLLFVNDKIRSIKIMGHLGDTLQRFFCVRSIINEEKPDIIHTHLLVNKYVAFAKPNKQTKIFHTIHSDLQRQWSRQRENRMDYCAMKKLFRKNDTKIIALHEKMRKEVNDLFGVTNTLVLKNGVDTDSFLHNTDCNAARKAFNIPADAFVIGCVGRFNQVKNHDFLIDIFAEYNKKHKNSYLLLVGDGNLKDNIKLKLERLSLWNNTVILSGREDVPDLMRLMDVLLLTSFSEGVPLTVIEAQFAGTRCIVSDVVTKETCISNLIKYKSINESVAEWVSAIENYAMENIVYYDKASWDINLIVKKLGDIYMS